MQFLHLICVKKLQLQGASPPGPHFSTDFSILNSQCLHHFLCLIVCFMLAVDPRHWKVGLGRTCVDSLACFHIEIEVASQTSSWTLFRLAFFVCSYFYFCMSAFCDDHMQL